MIIRDYYHPAAHVSDSEPSPSSLDWFEKHPIPFYITFSIILSLVTIFCLYALYQHPRTLFEQCRAYHRTRRANRQQRRNESQQGLWGNDGAGSGSTEGSAMYLSDLKRQLTGTIPEPSPSPASSRGREERKVKGKTGSSIGQPYPVSAAPHRKEHYGPVVRYELQPASTISFPLTAVPSGHQRSASTPSPNYPPPSHSPSSSLSKTPRPRKSPSPPRPTSSPARSSPLRRSEVPASAREVLVKGSRGRDSDKPPPPRTKNEMKEEVEGYFDLPVGHAI